MLELDVLIVAEPAVKEGTQSAKHQRKEGDDPLLEDVLQEIIFFRVHALDVFRLHGCEGDEEAKMEEEHHFGEIIFENLHFSFLSALVAFWGSLRAGNLFDMSLGISFEKGVFVP